MISVQTVVDRINAVLDAENSDRYLFEQDHRPAINSSVEWLVSVFNRAFADRKLTEENLKDLVRTVVFQTNSFSRVFFNEADMGYKIWSVMRIMPEATVYPTNATITPVASPEISLFRDDLTFVRSKHSAKRFTFEEWDENVDNVFEAGNERISAAFKSYAFLAFSNYGSTSYNAGGSEVEIRPEWNNQFVGATFLKYPTPVQLITDNIEFPETLLDLVYMKAANFISFKQGDQTNLYGVTKADVDSLIQLMV